MGRLKNKVAFITGASSGIGKATAILFAKEGAKVAFIARRKDKGEQTLREIEAAGSEGLFIQADASNAEAINLAVKQTFDTFGQLDIGVNNAAIIGELGPLIEMSDETWRNLLAVNLDGVFYSLRAEARMMTENGGSIINVASVNAFIGAPGAAAYATSKHALLGLAKSAAGELASMNIRVNTVCPGLVATEMQEQIAELATGGHPEGFENPFLPRVPMGRMASTEEIANAILWLASDEASYFTGSELTPDGGLLA
jgi:NAD(P)-dependent dehydrogenase (short-subunit alcohol dehydrogenase family)